VLAEVEVEIIELVDGRFRTPPAGGDGRPV
jgi:hypothetical protein